MQPRHFLTLNDLTSDELLSLLAKASELKTAQKSGHGQQKLVGKVMAMIFEKSSTRTRVSFEAAMAQNGGHAIFLSPESTQLGRGEPMEDTARVLSNMVDIVMIRTFEHDKLEHFASYSDIPVINGLSDSYHPCQLLADLQTYYEHRGSIEGKKVVWLGDGNNMCHSYVNAAHLLNFNFVIAGPKDYWPDASIVNLTANNITMTENALEAVEDADLIVTDVWASMGQEDQANERLAIFEPFRVDNALLQKAKSDVLFMHCLPAHRGDEVTAEVIEGPHSVVWDEAGNRLHAQKALIEMLMRVND